MFSTILTKLQKNSIHAMALSASIASNIVKTLEKEFGEDLSSQDAIIDSIIELLSHQKLSAKKTS